MRPLLLSLFALVLLAPAACAQDRPAAPAEDPAGAAASLELTETEASVQALLAEDGVHVVHFWAPWCHNSNAELRSGLWTQLVDANEDVTFTFVTVFNDGEVAEDVLAGYGVPARVVRQAQPDHGPSQVKANRRTTFLGRPLTWTPTTWVFHRNGQLAFAVNYGEVQPDLLQHLLDNARTDWSH